MGQKFNDLEKLVKLNIFPQISKIDNKFPPQKYLETLTKKSIVLPIHITSETVNEHQRNLGELFDFQVNSYLTSNPNQLIPGSSQITCLEDELGLTFIHNLSMPNPRKCFGVTCYTPITDENYKSSVYFGKVALLDIMQDSKLKIISYPKFFGFVNHNNQFSYADNTRATKKGFSQLLAEMTSSYIKKMTLQFAPQNGTINFHVDTNDNN